MKRILTNTLFGLSLFALFGITALAQSPSREELLRQVEADPRSARSGNARLDAIIDYTVKLTLSPGQVDFADVEKLRAQGLGDLEILDLNNMVAYYCYTNRVANGLGLKTTIDSAREATLAVPV